MSHVNIVKRIKTEAGWQRVAIPRNAKGNYDWNALPPGGYLIEWYLGGKRRREAAGETAAEALEAQRLKHHELEGRKLGLAAFQKTAEPAKRPPLHVAVRNYLESVEALKKPNTYRKYEAVLDRFLDCVPNARNVADLSEDDLNGYVLDLKRKHKLSANSILHNAIIVAQFLKKHGRAGVTRSLQLPERITSLPKAYTDEQLEEFFGATTDPERALFMTLLMTGLREQEAMYLYWSDLNLKLHTVRVTAKPDRGFYPKRWEEREVPMHARLAELLAKHPHHPGSPFVFSSPTGNREQHMLDHCKAVANRANLDPESFDLKTFRSTFATRMLRSGFDVRTVQHWMGHKSLETTMRYLAPAMEVHAKLDQVSIPGLTRSGSSKRTTADAA